MVYRPDAGKCLLIHFMGKIRYIVLGVAGMGDFFGQFVVNFLTSMTIPHRFA